MANFWDADPVVDAPPKPVSAFGGRRVNPADLSEGARALHDRLSQQFPGIAFTSGYRDPAHNAAVRGAKGSQHIEGNALDISLRNMQPEQRQALIDFALNDPSVRGFGHYGNSIHVDTRQGPKAFWGPSYGSDSFGAVAPELLPRVQQWASGGQGNAMALAGGGNAPVNPLASVPPPVARPTQAKAGGNFWDDDPVVEKPFVPPPSDDPVPEASPDPRTMRIAPRSVQEQGLKEGSYLADALRQRLADNRAGPLGKIDAAVRGAAEWLPGMNKLAAGGDALFGSGQGATFGERYADNLARQRALDDADALLNPNSRLAGQVAGVVPMAAITPMVNVARGAGMGATMTNAAATGATYGGLAGAIEADQNKLEAGATGAALGGAIGGALPPALAGVGKLFGATAGAITAPVRGMMNPTGTAERKVAQALAADGAQDATQRLATLQQGGAPAVLADAGGEATRGLARSAGNISGEARNVMRETLDERFAGQADRMVEMIRGTGAANAGKTLEEIQQTARAANRPAYAKAYADGSGGVINEELLGLMRAPAVLDAIRSTIKTGANKAAADGVQPLRNPFAVDAQGNLTLSKTADGGVIKPNVQFWDYVQRELRDEAEKLARAGANDGARDVRALRTKILEQVDGIVPSFADARMGAARAFGAEDALEAGAKFITSKMKADEARRALAKMKPQERELFAEGARTELIQKVRSIGDSRDVTKAFANNPAAREQLEVALGKDGANRLIAGLDIERTMGLIRTAVQGNSSTVQQLIASGGASSAGYGYLTGDISPQSLLLAAVTGAGARRYADAKVAKRVAEVLMSDDPKQIERLLTAASKQKSVLDVVRSIEERVLPLVSSQAGANAPAGTVKALQGPVTPRAEGEQQ